MCSAGACVPQTLFTGLNDPVGLTTLGGALFWGEAGTDEFRTCSAEPPCTPSRVYPGFAFPGIRNITRDGTGVYETNVQDMRRCVPGVSCPGNTFALSQTSSPIAGFFANDALVLMTNTVVPNGADPNVFLGRGLPLTPATLATQAESPTPTAITLAGDVAVWIAAGGTRVDRCRLGASGCADPLSTLVAGRLNATAIVGTATHVFWTEGTATSGAVLRCPLGACPTPTVFATTAAFGGTIAVDGNFVYFASSGVLRCPLSAEVCTPTALATSPGQPRALTFDAKWVYWIEPSGIYRVAK